MTIYELKPAFQRLLRPLVGRMARAGVTANQVTVFAAALSFLIGAILTVSGNSSVWFVLPLFMLLRMALNAIDGMLAREHDMKTPLGAIWNELGDVLSDAALYLPFALLPGFPAWAIVLVVVLAVISEMCGVLAVSIGATRRYDGPMGKSDRAFVFSVLAILYGCGLRLSFVYELVSVVLIGLLLWTIFNRLSRALKEAA